MVEHVCMYTKYTCECACFILGYVFILTRDELQLTNAPTNTKDEGACVDVMN